MFLGLMALLFGLLVADPGAAADGFQTPPRDVFDLLDAVARPGRPGIAAVLAMGLRPEADLLGHLRALLEDRRPGRLLSGEMAVPVPMEKRVAAALALGLGGDLRGFQILRLELLDPDLPDGLGAAVVTGLSFSGWPPDVPRFLDVLRTRATKPRMARAAAAGLERLGWRPPGCDKRLREGGAEGWPPPGSEGVLQELLDLTETLRRPGNPARPGSTAIQGSGAPFRPCPAEWSPEPGIRVDLRLSPSL